VRHEIRVVGAKIRMDIAAVGVPAKAATGEAASGGGTVEAGAGAVVRAGADDDGGWGRSR
jgi:hypothetical protein